MKLSVVMSTYNETIEELRRSIDSILNQTYNEFEFIIVCDNSEHKEAIKLSNEYKTKDARIKLLFNDKNRRLPYSLNKGIDHANGEYIARMDADDESFPQRFEIQMQYIEKYKCSLVGANIIVKRENREIKINFPEVIDKKLLAGCLVAHSAVIFNKQDFYDVGGYRELQPAEDYDLWLRFLSDNKEMRTVPGVLVEMNQRENGISLFNAYKQQVTAEYCKTLFRERKAKKTDSFTFENYQSFLKSHGYNHESKRQSYNESVMNFRLGGRHLRQFNIKGVYYLVLSLKNPRVFFFLLKRYLTKLVILHHV